MRKLRTLDKVSNRTRLVADVDLRGPIGRRYSHLCRTYEAELGGDLSEAELGLLRQAVTLQLRVEAIQADILAGRAGRDSDDALIRLSSESRRLLDLLRQESKERKHKAEEAAKQAAFKERFGVI